MTAIHSYHQNKSFLSNNKFEFVLNRIPNFTFLVQSVNLPSVALATTGVNTPFTQIFIPGNQLSFGQLTISFILDEDMRSWYEIFEWMYELGNPEELNKIGRLTNKSGFINSVTSDAKLFIKTNSNNPNYVVTYKDVFPADLGEISFSVTEDQEFLTSSVTFNYTSYDIEKV